MSNIFWELPAIPIPEDSYINKSDGRIYLVTKGGDKNHRLVIGRGVMNDQGKFEMMHPNTTYQFKFPQAWNDYYGAKQHMPSYVLNIGMYAMTLYYSESCGLYKNIIDSFGPLHGNAIMDYCMFLMQEHTNAVDTFEEYLKTQLCFSRTQFSDSWFSNIMANCINGDQIHSFKMSWLKSCISNGHNKIWLCIDGSNNDCLAKDCELAEHGHNKSGNDKPIISYIWAVSAKDGLPITWFVNNGGMVDQKALKEVVLFLNNSGCDVEGVILDRGFCTREVIELLKNEGLNYIIMLKSSTYGFKQMMLKHADQIRHDPRYIVNKRGIFGVTDNVPLFADSTEESCVGLYFDWPNAADRGVTHICKVQDYSDELKKKISQGYNVEVSKEYCKFIEIINSNEGHQEVVFKYDEWKNEIDSKGYSAIASSEQIDAKEIDKRYDLRDVSEKNFRSLKSYLDERVTCVHTTNSIENRIACGFIASIIRTHIVKVCRSHKIHTNKLLELANRCFLTLLPNGRYNYIDNISNKFRGILSDFGLHNEHLKYLENDANDRLDHNDIMNQIRSITHVEIVKKRGRGRPPKPKSEDDNQKPKRRPGRPKGSKNKKTLAREAEEAKQPAKVKRRPGRPKGSKNKKTLEREALQADKSAEPKRGRGRPKGSKNKTEQERKALAAAQAAQPKRAPGRPKGSKNRKTLEREAEQDRQQREAEQDRQHETKRGPGRPKGGKNQKTLEREAAMEKRELRKARLAQRRAETEADAKIQ